MNNVRITIIIFRLGNLFELYELKESAIMLPRSFVLTLLVGR